MLFSFCSSRAFQETAVGFKPPYRVQLMYTSLAAGTIEIKASRSQGDLFVHKPTSKLTLPPLSPSFLLQHSQMELNILSLAVR